MVVSRSLDNKSFPGWKCDDLTPDLCDLTVVEGSVKVRGGIDVHYWKYELAATEEEEEKEKTSVNKGKKLPIVTLHGGPAWPHNYMLPLKQQACRGRPVYFYDQAGCGESKPTTLKDGDEFIVSEDYPWLLTTEYYAQDELPVLIAHWGLEEYHLLGNSWGSALALAFALDTPATGMASLILSGPFIDGTLYMDAQWDPVDGSLGSLPPYLQQRVHYLVETEGYETEEYNEISDALSTKFTCRSAPYPDCLMDSINRLEADIYVGMQGPSEFAISGALGEFSVINRLDTIDLPVLITSGKYDTMRPPVVKAMQEKLPKSTTILLEKSAHLTMIDEPKAMNDGVANFLDAVETGLAIDPTATEDTSTLETTPTAMASGESSMHVLLTGSISLIIGILVGVFVSRVSMNSGSRKRSGYDAVE